MTMPRRRSPWVSGAALSGAAAGAFLCLAVWLLPSSWLPASRLMLPPALLIAAYAVGVLFAYRRREEQHARLFLEVREELRLSQDHIMANETYRSLSAYLEIAAHQMKEPLQALMGGLKTLAAESGLPETLRERVAGLKSQGESLHETLRHLAGYAITRPGRAPFSVNILLHEAILLCRQRAAEKKIVFEERYAVVPPVMGSALRVHQALFNVIVNAVEAMPFGGGTIVVETAHQQDRIIARVRDSGIGIRPEHLPQVFQPFFTTKPEKKGVGLGLWAARQMLDIIGADITIKSAPHQGTEVTMTFAQAAPLRPGREGTLHPPEIGKNTADEGDRRIA
jgi:signal transduction histidine kinase